MGEAASSPSPIGYWVYEGPTDGESRPCAAQKSFLRWDFSILQSLGNGTEIDLKKTNEMIARLLALDGVVRVKKILIGPHLKLRLGLKEDRVPFQGCDAARHDDHVHVTFETVK
jgi:hypothetical protein